MAPEPPDGGSVRLIDRGATGAGDRRSWWITLPGGLVASLLCHAVLILWAVGLFDSAKPLAAPPPQAITVDLVPDKQVREIPRPPRPAEPEAKPKPAEPEISPKRAEPEAKPAPREFDQLRPSLNLATHPARWTPPPAPQPAAVPAAKPPSPDVAAQKAAAAARLADAMQLPITLPGAGDTRPAETGAKLEHDIITKFKSHLNSCWIAPPPSADARRVKVLIRVVFNRNGTFLREPMLIGGTPSPSGPVLMRSAMQALDQCQPYSFLPIDKYKEWKVLDLAFSPQGIL